MTELVILDEIIASKDIATINHLIRVNELYVEKLLSFEEYIKLFRSVIRMWKLTKND